MPLIAEALVKAPINPSGSTQTWVRKVKAFEGALATVETDVNNWIAAEALVREYMAVLDIVSMPNGAGNNARVLVSYGYFVPS